MVKAALMAARQIKDVETEFIHLCDYKYGGGCIACHKCDIEPDIDKLCRSYNDDHNKILKKEIEADGFIWGSPVYFQGISSQWKMWMDRHECIGSRTGTPLRNKPVGCVAVGGGRHGGQEQTIEDMLRGAYMLDMIPIGCATVGPVRAAGGFHGACGVQTGWPETDPSKTFAPEALEWVKYDKLAMSNCYVLGERVAEMAKVIKAGFTLVNPENGETRWPVHRNPKELIWLDLAADYKKKGIIE